MSRARRNFHLALIASLVLVGCSSSTVPQREVSLRKALPPGTSTAVVESYLNEHQIEHSPLNTLNKIGAMIRDDRQHEIVLKDESLEFSFDQNKKLINITSQPSLTGP